MRKTFRLATRPLGASFVVAVVSLATFVVACDHNAASSGAATTPSPTPNEAPIAATSTPTPTPTTTTTTTATMATSAPRLADADVTAMQKGLKCAPAAKSGPCKVVALLGACKTWGATSPSGDARFIGHGYSVAAGKTSDQVTVLRARTVPQTEVAPWQLTVKIALGEIPKTAGPAFTQADRAINAFERHDVPPPKNATIELLKAKSDWTNEAVAARTMGTMVQTFSDHPTYLCLGEGQQLVMVQQASEAIGVSADGLYAELWPASW